MSLEKEEIIILGEKREFTPYTKGLGEFYFEKCDTNSENVFQIDPITGISETFASIKERSVRLAINLKKLGATSSDLVMICSLNSMDNCIPHISALYLGAKTAALHPTQSIREWALCMKLVPATFVFLEENFVENMEKCLEDLETKPELIVFGKSDKYKTFDDLQIPSKDEDTFRPVEVENCRDTAIILFTSGTTGPPKGLRISHFSAINKTVSMMGPGPVTEKRVAVTCATINWVTGIVVLTLSFYTGTSMIVAPEDTTLQQLVEMIEKYKIYLVIINPVVLRPTFAFNAIEKYDISSFKSLFFMGNYLNEAELLEIRKKFKHTFVVQSYGCSETMSCGTSFVSYRDRHLLHKLQSVGKVTQNCEIKIVDLETGKTLGPNKSGEIYVKSPFSFSGYCNTDSTDHLDKDGFFKTGDLGYYDEDECFYFAGRLREGFKYNIYSIPINYLEFILQDHPDVLQAGVFGIPNDIDGHLPAACITLKVNATSSVNDIEEFYTKNVADWHRLRGGIKVVDRLPMTSTNKIQRHKLLKLFVKS